MKILSIISILLLSCCATNPIKTKKITNQNNQVEFTKLDSNKDGIIDKTEYTSQNTFKFNQYEPIIVFSIIASIIGILLIFSSKIKPKNSVTSKDV